MKKSYQNLQNCYCYTPQEASNKDGILKHYFKSAKKHWHLLHRQSHISVFTVIIYENHSHYRDTLKYLLHINSSATLISAKTAHFCLAGCHTSKG